MLWAKQGALVRPVIDLYYGLQEPEYVIHIKGIDYAFIYRATSP